LWAGCAGYLSTVVVIAIVDLLSGRSLFHTPAMLGRTLVGGAGQLPAAAAVLAYDALHLLVFLIIGIVVVRLAAFVEVHPAFWYIAYFVCVLGFLTMELTFPVLDPDRAALSWWSVLLATASAAFSMGLLITVRHPRLRERLGARKEI